MSFISYAQNAEDVMLWRVLRNVAEGFYIDVGANDPVEDSVTKAFYDRGWHGINIEPVPRHYHDLVEQRPNDINLHLVAAAQPGSFTLFEIETMRGWGTLDPAMAEQYRQQGYVVAEISVMGRTLAEICQEHVRGEVHFLKIDVEGAEEQVLRGMNFRRWRPWIVIAEAKQPTGQGLITAAWESLLLEQGYAAIYCDGINTFYLADEHREELQNVFAAPPNILDDFVRHSEWQAGRYAEHLEANLEEVQQYARTLEAALQQSQMAKLLLHLYASRFWKITAPLRAAYHFVSQLLKDAPILPGRLMHWVARRAEASPALNALARRGLRHFPGLKDRMKWFYVNNPVDTKAADPLRSSLSAEAREIYDLLRQRNTP